MTLEATTGPYSACDTETVTTGALNADYIPTNGQGVTVIARGFSIGTAGDVKIKTPAGHDVVIPSANLAVGVTHPHGFVKIYASGTTAQSIVACG